MSERMFDHWLNLAPEQQMQVLGALVAIAQQRVAERPWCANPDICGGQRCTTCRGKWALDVLNGVPATARKES